MYINLSLTRLELVIMQINTANKTFNDEKCVYIRLTGKWDGNLRVTVGLGATPDRA